eukprot:403361531
MNTIDQQPLLSSQFLSNENTMIDPRRAESVKSMYKMTARSNKSGQKQQKIIKNSFKNTELINSLNQSKIDQDFLSQKPFSLNQSTIQTKPIRIKSQTISFNQEETNNYNETTYYSTIAEKDQNVALLQSNISVTPKNLQQMRANYADQGLIYQDHIQQLMSKIRLSNKKKDNNTSFKSLTVNNSLANSRQNSTEKQIQQQPMNSSELEKPTAFFFNRPSTGCVQMNFRNNKNLQVSSNLQRLIPKVPSQKRQNPMTQQNSLTRFGQDFKQNLNVLSNNFSLLNQSTIIIDQNQQPQQKFSNIKVAKNRSIHIQNTSQVTNNFGFNNQINENSNLNNIISQDQTQFFQSIRNKRLGTAILSKRASLIDSQSQKFNDLSLNKNLRKNSNISQINQKKLKKLKKEQLIRESMKNNRDQSTNVLSEFMFQNETHILKSISGFDHLEDDIEHELQPWNIDSKEYEGHFQDGQKTGLGRIVYPNGDIYKGQFQKDQKQGSGTILYADGRYYKGNWANDVFHGKGIYKMTVEPEALIIEGNFENGKFMPGHSKVQYSNGEIYEGKLTATMKREGQNGKFYFLNGDRYEGEWVKDVRQGKGKLFFYKGGEFEGTFKDDEIYDGKLKDKDDNIFINEMKSGGYFLRGKLNGLGKGLFANGDEYEGEFRDGVFSGKGKITYKNLDQTYYEEAVYVGQFRNHKREGYGEMKWNIGKEQFKGWWRNDQRYKGCMSLSDGNIYDGEWKNDVFHGKGQLKFKAHKKGEEGITFEGQFEDGHQQPEGKLFYPNGDIYIGQIDEYKKDGKGIMYLNNGDIQDCFWIDERKNGTGFIQYQNGDCFKGEFRDDKIDGFGTFFIQATLELYIGNWINNNRQGQAYIIYKDQAKYYEGNFKNNKMDGQGQIINKAPDMLEILSQFNLPDDWNSVKTTININIDLVQMLQKYQQH